MVRNGGSYRRDWLNWRALVIAALLVVAWQPALCGRAAQADPADNPLLAGILSGLRDEIGPETTGRLSSYTIDVNVDPSTSTITGDATIAFVNQSSASLSTIALRLYPNADHYGTGNLDVGRVRLDGRAVEPLFEVDETAMILPLSQPLPSRATVELDLTFTVTVPSDSSGTFGVFSHARRDGTWVLADWYPILAGFEEGTGWRLDPAIANIDPTFSDAAFYDVTITTPPSLTVVATGTQIASELDGVSVRRQFVSGPAREFAFVADEDYVAVSAKAGTTLVTSYSNPGGEVAARQTLDLTVRAIETYSTLFGRYPYEELDIVDTPLAGAIGVSWTGIVFINGDLVYDTGAVFSDPERFEYLIAHEMGHQWWGGTAGANSNDHTFMTEGLTNAGYALYLDAVYGPEIMRQQVERRIVAPYLAALAQYGDAVVDIPISAQVEDVPRGAIDYGKAAIGFLAIREQIGAEPFARGLRQYANAYRFDVGEPDDLLSALEAASGQELDDLWAFWFASAATTEADVEAVVVAL
jgi:aminopeptidase N